MQEFNEPTNLRSYVLGESGVAERDAIDERLLTDPVFFEKLTMAEEDLIQDYVDGNLSAAEREKFENRFLNSAENKQRLKFARALRRYVDEAELDPQAEPQNKPQPSFFNSLKAFLLSPVPIAAAVLVVLGLSGWLIWNNRSNRSEVLTALNKAYRTERPLDARISGLDYAPVKNTRGSSDEKSGAIDRELARMLALRAASDKQTAENLHALGQVYLTEKNFRQSIEQFEKAVRLAPEDAKLRNDYGAALMEYAKTLDEGKLENLARANEEFAKAMTLDKNLLEAYFNRALCIQALNLPHQASEAWRKYLELDSNSKWADEARRNLETIETNQPVSKTKEEILLEFLGAKRAGDREKAWQTLSRNREMITGKLIPQQLAFLFVDAKAAADEAKAKEHLEALVFAAELEEEKANDLYWKDIAVYYSKIPDNRIPLLKRAQDHVREGNRMRASLRYKDSLNNFQAAKTLFFKIQNFAEEKLCDYWIGVNLFQLNRIGESNSICEKLTEFGKTKAYKWLAVISHLRLAFAYGSRNDHARAIEESEKALEYIETINDNYDKHRALTIIANKNKDLGQYAVSLNFSEKSLAYGQFPDASLNQKWLDYESITGVFQEIGHYHSAAAFQREALAVTQQLGNRHNEQVSNMYLAKIYLLQKDFNTARHFIENSTEIAASLADQEAREKALAVSRLLHGSLMRLEGKYEEAIEILDKVSIFFDRSEFQWGRYNAHKEKFLTYLQIRNDNEVRSELDIILELFRFHRTKILEEQKRNSFFENKQDVYDLAVDYEFAKGKFDDAFDYLEESRARSLLDLQNSVVNVSFNYNQPEIKFSPNVTEPLKIREIQAEMPENVQLVQYAVLNDKLLIWLITKHQLSVGKTDISKEALENKVLTYLKLLSENADPEEQRKLSVELYELLIGPIRENLDAQKELFLIPDKALLQIPFGTLFSGRYLVEDYTISYAPSANVFLFCTKRARELGVKTSEVLLSIGNPTFNQTIFKDLQALPSAKREAIEIAQFYNDPFIFTEKEATKERIKENLKQADVVHFAGHYVVDENLPMLSGLILAGKDKDEVKLANYEIVGEKLSQSRLIILSACQTGIERYYNGEGMIGASRTYLATGVPLIVVSQWKVDSDASAKLMSDFHRRRKNQKLSTASALRQAQIEMLRSEKYQQPYYWAAFINLGGYSEF